MKKYISLFVLLSMVLSLFVPQMTVMAAKVDSWTVSFIGCTEGVDGIVEVVTNEKASGKASLHCSYKLPEKSMRYVGISQKVPVEKGKTYVYGMKVKANKGDGAVQKLGSTVRNELSPVGSTYDWTEFKFTYYHATDEEQIAFSLNMSSVIGDVWFDDIYLYEKDGEKVNLIKNPGFEGAGVTSTDEELTSEQKAEIYGVGDTEAVLSKIKNSSRFTYEEVAGVMAGFKYSAVFPAHDIKIDGDESDWANYAEMYMPVISDQYYVAHPEFLVNGTDATARYKFAYDDKNLYVLIAVKDDIHVFYDNETQYWKGDSVQLAICQQGHSYDNEISFVHNEDEKKGTAYSSTLGEAELAEVKVSTKRIDNVTTYEAAIPWNSTFDVLPQKCLLSFLVNENDGLGRAYLIEVDPKGISISPKSSQNFPVLELVEDGKDWYAWLEGNAKPNVGEESVYELYVVNRGDEKTLKIDIPEFNKTEVIKVPANAGIRNEYVYSTDVYGDKTIECIISEGDISITTSFDIFVNPNEGYFDATVDEMRYKAKELNNLIRRCKKEGIPTDYEDVRYFIYNHFIDWFVDDIAHDEIERTEYTLNALEEIYQKTKKSLTGYLNGTLEALEVPKYVSSKADFEGSRIIADVEYEGEITKRPIFATGLLVHNHEDIKYFDDMGFDFLHMGIGIYNSMAVASGIDSWVAASNKSVGVPVHKLERTSEAAAEGNHSIKMIYESEEQTNLYRRLYQAVAVKPNTLYKWGFKAKAVDGKYPLSVSATGGVPFNERKKLPEGTYDWTSFDYEYTTGEDLDMLKITFLFDGPMTIYIDDVYLYEGDSKVNLLENGGFETAQEEGIIAQEDYSLLHNYLTYVQAAEDNNIMYDLLLNSHYFLSELYDVYEDLKYPGGGFIPFYLDHPVARQVIEEHIKTLFEHMNQFDNLNSVCVLNEPWHTTNNANDHYTPMWIEYLKNEYSDDISKLNEVYGSEYTSFDEVPYYYGQSPDVRYYDYIQFNDNIHLDFMNYIIDTVKKYTDLPVHMKTMQYITSTDHEKRWLLGAGANPEKISFITDINGNDSELKIEAPFDTYLDGKIVSKSFFYDYQRSMKEAPVYNSEDHISNNGEKLYDPAFAKNVRNEQWMSALHGRAMTAIWTWDRSRKRDYTADNLTFRPDVMETIATVNLDLDRLAEYAYEIIDKPADVGIFLSTTSRILDTGHLNSVYKVYENLLYQGIKPLFATDTKPELIHNYDIVFLPSLNNIQRKTLDELKKFVDNGGKLIIFNEDSLKYDEHNRPHPEKIVSYIKSNAEIYKMENDGLVVTYPSQEEIYGIVEDITKDMQRVTVIDAETGERIKDAEYQYAEFKDINGEDGIVINISNYDWSKDKNVQLYIDGKLIEKPFELRSNKYLESTFTLESFTPILIKVTK